MRRSAHLATWRPAASRALFSGNPVKTTFPQACAALCAIAAAALTSRPRPALAFTLDSQLTAGCHESITSDAMRRVRQTFPDAARVGAVGEEVQLVPSLPFAVPDDMSDVGSATLLIANRDVDLEGGRAVDATRLAQIHSNPETQDHHCLRAFGDDEPDGAQRALAACRARIRLLALDAAHFAREDGSLDPNQRLLHTTDIVFHGAVPVPLPAALVRLGEAMHGVQDGFAHTYRTEDGMRVVTVLNFVDPVAGRDSPARDGPAHLAGLDRCDDPDPRRATRHRLAIEASADLAIIVLDPGLKDEREARIDAFLEKYFSLEPGCTAENNFCDAPEAAYANESACGCAVPGKPSVLPTALGAFGALFLVAGARRRITRRTDARRRLSRRAAALVVAATLSAPVLAQAQATPPVPKGDEDKKNPKVVEDPKPPAVTPAQVKKEEKKAEVKKEEEKKDEALKVATGTPARPDDFNVKLPTSAKAEDTKGRIGIAAAISIAQDNPAAAASLGGRYNLGYGFLIGPDIEWNPWRSFDQKRAVLGVLNMYLTGVHRWSVGSRWIHLRTTAKAGVSRMLFDLYGAPNGTMGPYLGFSLLGLELNVWRGLAVLIEPSEIAVPVPQISGTPLIYAQYRFALGIQWGAVP